jgi:hypothetical protein
VTEFKFIGCIEIKELLGQKADNAIQLLELMEDVHPDSIYYHMHSYFLRHVYLSGPFPNDFANWAAIELRDSVLGEKLANVSFSPEKSLEDVRMDLVETIDRHLSGVRFVSSVSQGTPFHFMKSEIVEVPLGKDAGDLSGFIDVLQDVHASALYYHIFEARIRVRKGRNDFSIWLDDILGYQQLAERIEGIDFYMFSLERLRSKILDLCRQELRS